MRRNIIFYLFALLPVLFTGCSSDSDDSPLEYDNLYGTIWQGTLKEVSPTGQTLKSYQAYLEFTSQGGCSAYVIDSNGDVSDLVSYDSVFDGNKWYLGTYSSKFSPFNRGYSLIKSSSNYMAWESFGINSWILTLRKKY